MTSLKLDVEVFEGATRVETLSQRPVRVLPNKRAGVVYGGEVYPLRPGDRIDLTDSPVKKIFCPGFVAPTAKVVYSTGTAERRTTTPSVTIDRWYLESNRFGHYIVFDAAPATAKKVVAMVETAGLGVRRWDESVRESDNGELYDWFIRLEFDGSREECLARVSQLLSPPAISSHSSPPTAMSTIDDRALASELRRLRTEVSQVQAEAALLRAEATAVQAAEATKAQRAAAQFKAAKELARALQDDLQQELARAGDERAALRDKIASLEKELETARHTPTGKPDPDERLAALSQAKRHAEDEWLKAQQLAEATHAEVTTLRAKMRGVETEAQVAREDAAALQTRLEHATSQLAEIRDQDRERRSAARSAGGPPQGSLDTFLQRLLPRVTFDANLVEMLLAWPSPASALDFLRQIDARQDPRGKKPIKGKSGWWEIPRVNTDRPGKEVAGRIYFAPSDNGRVFTVLHEKEDDKEQERFITRLPDRP